MFNLIMGIIMLFAGLLCVIFGIAGSAVPASMAAYIFIGVMLFVFGIVEIVRSRKLRKRKSLQKDREFDAYMKMASEMGVVVNPITHEIVSAEKKPESSDDEDTKGTAGDKQADDARNENL